MTHVHPAQKASGLLAALSLAALPIAACSSSGEKSAGSANQGGMTELTVFIPQGADQNLQTNAYTKLLSGKFKINFKFQTTTYDAALRRRSGRSRWPAATTPTSTCLSRGWISSPGPSCSSSPSRA